MLDPSLLNLQRVELGHLLLNSLGKMCKHMKGKKAVKCKAGD